MTVREFDARDGRFLAEGFRLPEGKHRFDWIDADTLLVVTALSAAESTTSGYPYIARLLKRGQTLAEAREVFRGAPGTAAMASPARSSATPRGAWRRWFWCGPSTPSAPSITCCPETGR